MSKDHWKKCINLSQGLFFLFYAFPPLGFQRGAVVKNLPAKVGDAGDQCSIPGQADPLEEERATCSCVLTWKIPWTELTQFSLVTRSCPTLCHPVDGSAPGFPVHPQRQELAQTHVHRVSDAIQLSPPLSSPSPPAFNIFQQQDIFQWVSSSH